MTAKRGKFHQPGKSNQITVNFKILNISTSAQQAHTPNCMVCAVNTTAAAQPNKTINTAVGNQSPHHSIALTHQAQQAAAKPSQSQARSNPPKPRITSPRWWHKEGVDQVDSKTKIKPSGPGGGELDQGQVQELEVSGKAPDQASHKINNFQQQHPSVVSIIKHPHILFIIFK